MGLLWRIGHRSRFCAPNRRNTGGDGGRALSLELLTQGTLYTPMPCAAEEGGERAHCALSYFAVSVHITPSQLALMAALVGGPSVQIE